MQAFFLRLPWIFLQSTRAGVALSVRKAPIPVGQGGERRSGKSRLPSRVGPTPIDTGVAACQRLETRAVFLSAEPPPAAPAQLALQVACNTVSNMLSETLPALLHRLDT